MEQGIIQIIKFVEITDLVGSVHDEIDYRVYLILGSKGSDGSVVKTSCFRDIKFVLFMI